MNITLLYLSTNLNITNNNSLLMKILDRVNLSILWKIILSMKSMKFLIISLFYLVDRI